MNIIDRVVDKVFIKRYAPKTKRGVYIAVAVHWAVVGGLVGVGGAYVLIGSLGSQWGVVTAGTVAIALGCFAIALGCFAGRYMWRKAHEGGYVEALMRHQLKG